MLFYLFFINKSIIPDSFSIVPRIVIFVSASITLTLGINLKSTQLPVKEEKHPIYFKLEDNWELNI